MLPKYYRFFLRQDPSFFERAKKEFFTSGVIFYTVENLLLEPKKKKSPLIATVVVPKKKFSLASQRNYIKRVGAECVFDIIQKTVEKQLYKKNIKLTLVVYINRKFKNKAQLTLQLNRSVQSIIKTSSM